MQHDSRIKIAGSISTRNQTGKPISHGVVLLHHWLHASASACNDGSLGFAASWNEWRSGTAARLSKNQTTARIRPQKVVWSLAKGQAALCSVVVTTIDSTYSHKPMYNAKNWRFLSVESFADDTSWSRLLSKTDVLFFWLGIGCELIVGNWPVSHDNWPWGRSPIYFRE